MDRQFNSVHLGVATILASTATTSAIDFGDSFTILINNLGAMNLFFEDGFGVDGLELGSEVGETLGTAV